MLRIRKCKYSSLFFRHLFSYILILVIPIIITTGIMISSFLDMFDKQVITQNLNTLNRLMYVIDNQLNQIKNTALQIEINKKLRPMNLKGNPIKILDIKDELLNYVVTNNFIENIFIYYRGEQYIYSSYGSSPINMFVDDVYGYNSWDKSTFFEDINSITSSTIYFSKNTKDTQNSNRYFIFAYSIPFNSTKPYATSLFVVSEDSFRNAMRTTLKDYTENTIILDKNNQVISCLRNDDYIHTQEFLDVISELGETTNVKYLHISGKTHLIFSVQSSNTYWRYVSVVPIYKIREEVSKTQKRLVTSVLLVVFVGGIGAYYISKLNYKPIKLLEAYAKTIWNGSRSGQNEVENVRETLDFLLDKNFQLDKKLKSGEVARREYLLTALLKGDIKNVEEFNLKGMDMGLAFTNELYRVIMLKFKSSSSLSKEVKKAIIGNMESQLSHNFEAYIRDSIEDDRLSLITCYSNSYDGNIQPILKDVKKYIEEKWDVVLTMGIGKAYNLITDIPKSYIEACAALDFRFIKGDGNIILYEQVAMEQMDFNSYPYDSIKKLEMSIKQGDAVNIEGILEELIDFIKDNNVPIFIARGISYDIVNTVIRTMNEIYKDFAFVNTKYPDVFALREFETVDMLIDMIKSICYDICAYVKEEKYNQCEQMLKDIISYIQTCYDDCDFSIQNMADEFNMSTSSISQYFKEQTGQNILDYVLHLKIEKAKMLLKETDMPVKDICKNIGYHNASSFIRRFKQITGVTPGEYRKTATNI